MAAHVLGLRAALLLGALRGPAGRVAWRVIGLVLLCALVVVACIGVLTLRDAPHDIAAAVLIPGGAALCLGFLIVPMMTGAVDPLDPRRFAVVGVSPGPLSALLVVAGLISVPGLIVIAVDACAAIVWIAHGVSWPLVASMAAVHAFSCILFARLSMAFTARVLRDGRTRELSSLFIVALVVVLVPVVIFLSSLQWDGRVPAPLSAAVEVLTLTPLGAAAGMPGAVLAGAERIPLIIVVALATLILAAAGWLLAVHSLLRTTEAPGQVRERAGLGWFALVPGKPAGAVAARSLVYWTRDGRYLSNIIIIPIASLLTIVPLMIAGVPVAILALVPVPVMALLFGWLPHNDLAYDSTAVWLHIAGGMRGISDRLGRLAPIICVAVPLLAVGIPLAVSIHGRWDLLPALVGVAACLFLAGLGLSSITSAVLPYPVSRPGDSPFQQPQRLGSAAIVTQTAVMAGTIIVSAPTLWRAWLALTVSADHAVGVLWLGLGSGAGILLIGILIGALAFDRRGTRIMEFAGAA